VGFDIQMSDMNICASTFKTLEARKFGNPQAHSTSYTTKKRKKALTDFVLDPWEEQK